MNNLQVSAMYILGETSENMSTSRDTSWQIAESSTSHFILSWHKSGSEDMFAGSKHAICLTMVCSWCLPCIFWTMLAKQSTQSLLNSNTSKKAWIFCTQAIVWSFSTIPLRILNISGEHLAFTRFCPAWSSTFECKSINIIMVSHVAMFHHILNQLRCDYRTVTLHYLSEKKLQLDISPEITIDSYWNGNVLYIHGELFITFLSRDRSLLMNIITGSSVLETP